VANALQHGEPSSGVHVLADGTAADGIRVDVHNMGEIPEELIPKLFEPMAGGQRRGDRSRGLGLGLYIGQEILRAHGGRIAVQSSAAAGTTFSVWLPRRVPAREQVEP
jgi:signal transduction histidine kinase